ncbi:C4-dicarboxylate transporter/malic acid transport protein [Shewanella halifaxensis HAW-EB4]|uniref:C4-dicarboxylate transporter/malic acid transport protein n=1 Tax=Shewanella halifaxensis (strain HAW-EB4) TaxID=458817 RepID=B0TJD9_SHEHH|nr:TDT family transporter [Shewanella halifaxensis]ABZ75730.1 C4-dicarboxylate transporter/malic acid transport protein [Shewanella halifaxensis HAW-EB4]
MSENTPIELSTEIGPNWFASVMGTGIIANAAIGLPMFGGHLSGIGLIIWLLASLMLITMILLKTIQTIIKPHIIKRQFNDPVMSQFFGAPPMAMLTIAGGTLLYGQQVMAIDTAITIAWGLWIVGTLLGLVTAVIIPFRLFTHHQVRDDAAFGGWLMPVVPPMVSAAIGAMLIPHVESITLQQTLLYACYAMFGISLFSALIIITMIWSRLAHSGTSGGARVPTLWIVLGPLGQSITAAGALGSVALLVVDEPISTGMNTMAILYGVPAWGFAFFWSILASLLTLRALRRKMPFALTWWAFTFPVGTCVTGTTQLALHTGLPAFEWAAVLLFTGLIFAWIIAAIGTIKGLKGGKIMKNPTTSSHVVSKKGQL